MRAVQDRWLDAADGARLRWRLWPAPADAHTVMLVQGGRSECAERYDETAAELIRRGYAPLSLDWRGQGRSHRAGRHPQSGHITDVGQLLDDLDLVFGQVVRPMAEGRPIAVLAHSMGGAALLAWLMRRDPGIRFAVLSAPMLRIAHISPPVRMIIAPIVRLMLALGQADAYAWGSADWSERKHRFEDRYLTQDRARYDATIALFRDTPELRVGGVSWGRLGAWLAQERAFRRPGALERVQTPLMITSSGGETLVDNAAIVRAVQRLPHARHVHFDTALHEVLQETDALRNAFWAEFDRFTADLA